MPAKQRERSFVEVVRRLDLPWLQALDGGLVPGTGFEPVLPKEVDFKSTASTYFAIRASGGKHSIAATSPTSGIHSRRPPFGATCSSDDKEAIAYSESGLPGSGQMEGDATSHGSDAA